MCLASATLDLDIRGPSIHCSSLHPVECLLLSVLFLMDGIRLGEPLGELVCAGEVLLLWLDLIDGRWACLSSNF